MLQISSTQTIDHIPKCFRQKFQCSRRPSYWTTLFYSSMEALKLRQGPLHFFKWDHVFFFHDIITDFKTNSSTYNTRSFSSRSLKIVENSKHIGIITFKGSTNLGLRPPTEGARNDDPRLVSTC